MSLLKNKFVQYSTPLEIPELMDLVVSYLDVGDFAACAQVSKSWHTFFIPQLWKEVTFDFARPIPAASLFTKYSHLIKSMTVSECLPREVIRTPFPCLQRLIIGSYNMFCFSFNPALLINNSSIEVLLIRSYTFGQIDIRFWRSVSNLHNLKEIEVLDVLISNQDEFDIFWETICGVESAKISSIEWHFQPSITSTTSMKLRSFSTICAVIEPALQLKFIVEFKTIQHLDWNGEMLGNDIVDIFTRRTWPDLHQIHLHNVDLDNMQLQLILSSITRLTALEIEIVNWGIESFHALSLHFETLEILRQHYNDSFTSVMINTVMCTFPNIKELGAPVINGADIINDNRINKMQQLDGMWICTRLEVLEVRFNIDDEDSKLRIAEKIAGLKRLEKRKYF